MSLNHSINKKDHSPARVNIPGFIKNEVSLVDKIVEEILQEKKNKGLWPNVHAKRRSGKAPAKPGDKNYPKTLNVGEENTITIEDANGNTFLEVVDLITPDPLVSEAIRIPAKTGNIVLVNLTWKGSYHGIKMFFPQTKLPSRKDIQVEIEKVYPGARVYSFHISDYEPGKPIVQVSEESEKKYCPKCKKMEARSECAYGTKYWDNNAK